MIVLLGPGGVGKGALVRELLRRDPHLWLSRSWTTRPQRPGEPDDAYVFVDKPTFAAARDAGRFLETNEFSGNGHFYGTPWPDPDDPSVDVVLEIDVNGAWQVKQRYPDALTILVVPPSREELERRLRGRGDDEAHVQRRLAIADAEVDAARPLADAVVVNDDLARAADEVARILEDRR